MGTDKIRGDRSLLGIRLALRLVGCLVMVLVAGLMALPPVWAQPDELVTAEQLNAQVVQLSGAGKYAKAILLVKKVLAIHEKVVGPEHLRDEIDPITLAQVQRAFPQGAVLLEWVRCQPFNSRAIAQEPKRGAPPYAVYLLTPSGAPVLVDLRDAQAIETLVADLLAACAIETRYWRSKYWPRSWIGSCCSCWSRV